MSFNGREQVTYWLLSNIWQSAVSLVCWLSSLLPWWICPHSLTNEQTEQNLFLNSKSLSIVETREQAEQHLINQAISYAWLMFPYGYLFRFSLSALTSMPTSLRVKLRCLSKQHITTLSLSHCVDNDSTGLLHDFPFKEKHSMTKCSTQGVKIQGTSWKCLYGSCRFNFDKLCQ